MLATIMLVYSSHEINTLTSKIRIITYVDEIEVRQF